ncbi:MAG: diguanylate cyclase [Pseudomonadota bacterium]|nr:diguanylate cyclase [Pseudomonadota bacterium]
MLIDTIDILQAALRAMPDPVLLIGRSGRYLAAYGAADARFHADGTWLIGKNLREVFPPSAADRAMECIERTLETGRMEMIEYELQHADNRRTLDTEDPGNRSIRYEARIQNLDMQIDGEDAVIWVARNIQRRHKLELRLRHLAETDELSGLANRRFLMRKLDEHFDLFCATQTPASLLYFDIDKFKLINDKHGHDKGDQVIRAIARIVRREMRADDIGARIGGDEFVVLLPDTRVRAAAGLAERLRQRVAKELATIVTGVSISVGVADFDEMDVSTEAILKRADAALYRAKQAGRNQVEIDITTPH